MNIQVSWSPIALWISIATTEESTPPLSAHSTFLSPTLARMSFTASSMKDSIVQLPSHPHTSYRKFEIISLPCTEWRTSGWNCTE
ncbi:hypothetical protein D3C71_1396290 [compost metagenome]